MWTDLVVEVFEGISLGNSPTIIGMGGVRGEDITGIMYP